MEEVELDVDKLEPLWVGDVEPEPDMLELDRVEDGEFGILLVGLD